MAGVVVRRRGPRLTAAGVNRPVWLVLIASALACFVAPVIFFLKKYCCFTVVPTDRFFYPSWFATVFGWLSLVMFTGMTGLLIWDQLR